MVRTKRMLWTASVAAVVLAAVLLLMPRQRPAAADLPTAALRDSIGTYEARLNRLELSRDSLKLALARRGLAGLPAVGRRVAQLDSLLVLARTALARFLAARDANRQWREYRDCLYYFGGIDATYRSLTHDTLPQPPGPERLPWQP
jgi:hypothetical protein